MRDQMLTLEELETTYNSLPARIKSILTIRESIEGSIEIGGGKQLYSRFYDRTMKYEKDKLDQAKVRFLSIFYDNLHLINKIGKLEETITLLSKTESGVDKRIVASSEDKKSDTTDSGISRSVSQARSSNKADSLTLTSDNNSGGEIIQSGCTTDTSTVIKYENVAFPTNSANQDLNNSSSESHGDENSSSANYGSSNAVIRKNAVYMDVAPAANAISVLRFQIPELRRVFGQKFSVLFI